MPKRGFAALPQERRWEIASAAGRKAQALGTAHRWTVEEARAAARKGLQARLATLARRRRGAAA